MVKTLATREYSLGKGRKMTISLLGPYPDEIFGRKCAIKIEETDRADRVISVWGDDDLEAIRRAVHFANLHVRAIHRKRSVALSVDGRDVDLLMLDSWLEE